MSLKFHSCNLYYLQIVYYSYKKYINKNLFYQLRFIADKVYLS